MKSNQNIIYCNAKITKNSIIKERTWIILRKTNVNSSLFDEAEQ